MLEPNTRTLLLDSLQPPEGFALNAAIGTTYTLDLYALLSVPVAFSFRAAMTDQDGVDPLATLEALRRVAANIHLFCQADGIQVPRRHEKLFAYLEGAVIPVLPTGESGVFHPKLWLLRFAGPDEDVTYRFICMSRNLTFDRSWDTALVLDGVRESAPVTDPDPTPLQRFVAALPALARTDVPKTTHTALERIGAELARVRFQCPPGIESLRFWPIGMGDAAPHLGPAHRPLLIVSPFVGDGWLQQVVSGRPQASLVSRDDQLMALSPVTRALFGRHYTLLPEATPETDPENGQDQANPLDGLHAKLFVVDDGWNAQLWTGSANATDAAFRHNVEMLVQLTGKKSQIGIDRLIGDDNPDAGFRDLLESWQPPEDDADATDPVAERLEHALRDARRRLASATLTVAVTAEAKNSDNPYTLAIEGKWPELPDGVSCRVWPSGLGSDRAQVPGAEPIRFARVTLEALSAFVAVELTAREQAQTQTTGFAMRLPITGLPEDRHSRLLRSMLSDPQEFMRLLLLLLADDGIDALLGSGRGESASHDTDWLPGADDAPLLESLLQSLDRAPERLDTIQRLLDDLTASGGLQDLLPEGFLPLWEAVWSNRKQAGPHG